MVTLQLMTTRQLKLVKGKKIKDMNPPEGKGPVVFLGRVSTSHNVTIVNVDR